MLYRHVQPLFLARDFSSRTVRGPVLRVRPLDGDAPDHLLRFVLWGALHEQAPTKPNRAPDRAPSDGASTPPRAQLLLEMSADGEGWVTQSTLDPRERPYLVTVAHVLPFIRVRMEGNGTEARGYALMMANAPFQLDGGNPVVDVGEDAGGRK